MMIKGVLSHGDGSYPCLLLLKTLKVKHPRSLGLECVHCCRSSLPFMRSLSVIRQICVSSLGMLILMQSIQLYHDGNIEESKKCCLQATNYSQYEAVRYAYTMLNCEGFLILLAGLALRLDLPVAGT